MNLSNGIRPFPKKKFSVIYADPPWKYDFSPSKHFAIESYYPTMYLKDIKKLPIRTADNAVLYLWATSPKLVEALEVMKVWGFKYKTHAVWDKDSRGMGYWFLGQHELLLVGTKGKFSPPKARFIVSSIYTEKRDHKKKSRKPKYFRDLITRSFQDESKIELFARDRTKGWSVWGYEV